MKKEMLIAVLIGLSFGLIITYGVYRAQTALNPKSSSTNLANASPDPEKRADSAKLALHSPEDESIQSAADVNITGTTVPSSFVVIFINNKEHITTSDETGNFSLSTKLDLGGNTISVNVLEEDGTKTTVERTVIYSTNEFEEPLADSASATPSAAAASPKPTPKASPKPSIKPSPKPSVSP